MRYTFAFGHTAFTSKATDDDDGGSGAVFNEVTQSDENDEKRHTHTHTGYFDCGQTTTHEIKFLFHMIIIHICVHTYTTTSCK